MVCRSDSSQLCSQGFLFVLRNTTCTSYATFINVHRSSHLVCKQSLIFNPSPAHLQCYHFLLLIYKAFIKVSITQQTKNNKEWNLPKGILEKILYKTIAVISLEGKFNPFFLVFKSKVEMKVKSTRASQLFPFLRMYKP